MVRRTLKINMSTPSQAWSVLGELPSWKYKRSYADTNMKV